MTVREKLQGNMLSQMRRYPQRGWIAGVCSGIAEHFDWNVKLLRLLLVVAGLCTKVFPLALAYLVLWYLMDPAETIEGSDNSAPRSPSTNAPSSSGTPPHGGAANPPVRTGTLKTRFSRLEQRLSSMEDCVVSRDFELRQELRKLES